jgi:hypothetical protein
MSKSHESLSIKILRENLLSPQPIIQWIAKQIGIEKKVSNIENLLEDFEISKLPTALYFPHLQ